MQIDVRGHPIHTRALSIGLSQAANGRIAVRGSILDLRKRGIVPVAADLQGPGVIHHMLVEASLEPASRRLEAISTRQPSVAFDASEITAGESCRDPAARLEALAGTALDGSFARHLSDVFGGPRGCSHVLTLTQLLGSTARWALDHDDGAARRPGERIFCRDVALDGHEPATGRIAVAIQLNDVWLAAAPAVADPMSRFGAQHEVRVLVEVDLGAIAIAAAEIAERRRSAVDLESGWTARPEIAAGLVGRPALHGITPQLLEELRAHPEDEPIYDALLMFAPTMIQCFATMSDAWLSSARGADSVIGMGGIPDSCYMWRREGALHRNRREGDPVAWVKKKD